MNKDWYCQFFYTHIVAFCKKRTTVKAYKKINILHSTSGLVICHILMNKIKLIQLAEVV